MAPQGTEGVWLENKVRGFLQRLTWNGGRDCWLDGVGLLHEGLDAGDRGQRESETMTVAAATS